MRDLLAASISERDTSAVGHGQQAIRNEVIPDRGASVRIARSRIANNDATPFTSDSQIQIFDFTVEPDIARDRRAVRLREAQRDRVRLIRRRHAAFHARYGHEVTSRFAPRLLSRCGPGKLIFCS